MAESKIIYISGGKINPPKTAPYRSGVDITYIKSRKVLSIGGWYDGCVGIENVEIPLAEFNKLLGISRPELRE